MTPAHEGHGCVVPGTLPLVRARTRQRPGTEFGTEFDVRQPDSHSLRRILAGLLRYSGAGLVVSVLVAWGSSLAVDPSRPAWRGWGAIGPPDQNALSADAGPAWSHLERRRWATHWVYRQAVHVGSRGSPWSRYPLSRGPWWSEVRSPPSGDSLDNEAAFIEEASGWPLPCLVVRYRLPPLHAPGQDAILDSGIRTGLASRWFYNAPHALPIRPIPLGLALNATTLGLACFVVVFASRRERSWWRARRGECRACGHPLAGLARCPECGQA